MIGQFRQALTFFFCALTASELPGSETALQLESSVSLVKKWQPDQHLYVDGDISLTPADLAKLEKWLDQNARNWTVLLAENSADESYRSAFGNTLRGLDAVEDAMTNGLQAKTGFGELRDAKTRLPNGAVFTIFLNEKQFSFFGADHYSRNGAPPKSFPGNLDGPARKAMRDGGRLADAVKDTITFIDKRVRDTLANRERNRLSQLAQAKEQLVQLRKRLVTISEKHGAIATELNGGGGDINRFPLTELKAQLQSMEERPGTYDVGLMQSSLDRWEKLLDQFRANAGAFDALEEQLNKNSAASSGGKKALATARAQLKTARSEYQVGNFSYLQALTQARNSADMVEIEDRAALRSAEKRAFAVKVGGATGVGGLCLLGVVGNRRRRRIKAEAEKLLTSRKLEMKETEDRLFELMDRAAVIVGPFNELENRGYSGDTLDLSKQALKHIDEAFVLSSNVQKIIEEGESLIEPGNPLSRSRNVVSSGRYEKAVDLLDAELNLARKNVPDLKERARPGEAVDETFSVPIDEWENRTTDALNVAKTCLDRVENAWSTIVARSEALGENIAALTLRRDEVQVDEWLRCERLFEEWLPVICERAEGAAETGKSDPVGALEGEMSEGDRMASEAKTLLDHLAKFRKNHWKALEKNEATLDQHHRATVWVDQSLHDFGDECEDIATDSPDENVAARIETLKTALEAFAKQIANAADLVVRADDQAAPGINTATQQVTTARKDLAKALDLATDVILVETGNNPSEFLIKANQQLEAALAALNLGDVMSAESFLNECDSLTAHASDLVSRSRLVLADYGDTSEQLWKARGTLEERGNHLQKEVEAMRIRYAPRALFIDPDAPESGTFANAPQELESDLKGITSRLDRAKTNFNSGALLEAWSLLDQGKNLASEGEVLCKDVTKRSKKLADMEEQNTSSHQSHSRAKADQERPVSDRRVTRETIQLFDLIESGLKETQNEIEAGDGRRDPFFVEEQLKILGERLPVLRKAISEDLENHARALALIDTISRNQTEAEALWETAEGDRIPNSPKTNEAMTLIEQCHAKLEDSRGDLEKDHADWREIQNELRAIHLNLSEAVIDLKQELNLARETVRALEVATREVRKADRWSGSHGVRMTGNYGRRSLAAANDVMQHGRYQEALSMAGQARSQARSAIASAEAREAAKRREAEAARRRRRNAARRTSFGNSSIGSRSSGGNRSRSSSSGGSSRAGRSSFSSGSRAGRSGW